MISSYDKMFPAVDEHGVEMIVVRKEELEDFPKFLRHLRSGGFGATTGIVKVRLHEDDRNDVECMEQVIPHLKEVFHSHTVVKERRGKKQVETKVPLFNIANQTTLRGAINDHIYEYIQEKSGEHRETYVQEALDPASYRTSPNCCSKALAEGLSCARAHFFEILEKRSPLTPDLLKVLGDATERTCHDADPILYAAGVPCPEGLNIPIGKTLNMNKLGTIMDLLKEKYDGVAFPYLYCASTHSFFCWHIEDGALASINYLFDGGKKIWMAIAPKYYGLVDHVVQGFRIDKAHTVCRAVLSDHKSVLFDPEFMRREHRVPYTMVQQDPGDFIITWPFTLHAGFNTSRNMAIAVNFGDEEWLDVGMYAPVCGCRDVVNPDVTPLIKMFRPEQFETWRDAASICFPPNHPRAIVTPLHLETAACHSNDSEEGKKRKRKVYECPLQTCQSVYLDHRNRVEPHIRKKHPNQADTLLEKLEEKYPSTLKSASSHQCPVCGFNPRGNVTHLERHMKGRLQKGQLSADDKDKYEKALVNLSTTIRRRKRHKKT